MSVLWKDCAKHNTGKGKKASVKKSSKGDQDVKTKNLRVAGQDISSLLSEATTATDGISEEEDLSSIFFYDHVSTYKTKAALLVDSCRYDNSTFYFRSYKCSRIKKGD